MHPGLRRVAFARFVAGDKLGTRIRHAIAPTVLLPYSHRRVRNRTETLEVGSPAPEFSLGAANREGVFTLGSLRLGGTLVLEFLRGTW